MGKKKEEKEIMPKYFIFWSEKNQIENLPKETQLTFSISPL